MHKAGLQVPHWRRWQEIQCLDCQVQPHGMLQKTSWPSCVSSASQISVFSAAAELEDNATRLSPAVSSLLVILCATPAAVLKSSSVPEPMSLLWCWDWDLLYF